MFSVRLYQSLTYFNLGENTRLIYQCSFIEIRNIYGVQVFREALSSILSVSQVDTQTILEISSFRAKGGRLLLYCRCYIVDHEYINKG